MDMIPVRSSNIKGAAYDAETATLYVQFANATYAYPKVPLDEYEAFAKTFASDEQSSTRHLNKFIKPRYPPTRLEPEK